MRIALAAALGIGVAVLVWLGLYPEPAPWRTAFYLLASVWYGVFVLGLVDKLESRKQRDWDF